MATNQDVTLEMAEHWIKSFKKWKASARVLEISLEYTPVAEDD